MTGSSLRPRRPVLPFERLKNPSTSLDVSWSAPQNTGPDIVNYDVEYRKGSETFSSSGVAITGTTATISGTDSNNDNTPWLDPNTAYEVRVKANNGERTSAWSASGMSRTKKANHQPIFDDRPFTGDTERSGK